MGKINYLLPLLRKELGSAKAAIRYFISPVAPIGGGGRRGEWRREERGVVKSQLEVVWQKPDPKGRKGAESRCIQNAKQVRTKCALFRRHS